MNLIYEIAAELQVPNEWIQITTTHQNMVWFTIKGQQNWTCKTVRNGEHLKKNSIRRD